MNGEEIELRRIALKRNRSRFHRPAAWPDLFGGFAVVCEWGRPAQPGTLRFDTYPIEAEACRACDRLCELEEKARRCHCRDFTVRRRALAVARAPNGAAR